MKLFHIQHLLPVLLAGLAGFGGAGLQAAHAADAASSTPARSAANIGDPEDARRALAAFEDMLRAFEAGNVTQIRQRLDPAMIGYQQLLDNITLDSNECKQMRVSLLNTQVQAGPDLAVIQTSWEKRCLMLPSFTPRISSGRATILLHLGASGWRFAAITGGNMFDRMPAPAVAPAMPAATLQPPVLAPAAAAAAPVTAVQTTPAVSVAPPVTPPVIPPITPPVTPPVVVPPAPKTLATLSVAATAPDSYYTSLPNRPGTAMLPFSIEVNDPDRASAASVNVHLVTVGFRVNDSLTLTLPALSAGRFGVSQVRFSRAIPTRNSAMCGTGDGLPTAPDAIEICPNFSHIKVSFTDTGTPGGASQTVSRTVQLR